LNSFHAHRSIKQLVYKNLTLLLYSRSAGQHSPPPVRVQNWSITPKIQKIFIIHLKNELRHSIHDLHRSLWRFWSALIQIVTHLRHSIFVQRLEDNTTRYFTVICCAQTGTPSYSGYLLYEVTPVFRGFPQANSTIAPVDISKIYNLTIQRQIIIPREHTWHTATFGAGGGGVRRVSDFVLNVFCIYVPLYAVSVEDCVCRQGSYICFCTGPRNVLNWLWRDEFNNLYTSLKMRKNNSRKDGRHVARIGSERHTYKYFL